MSSAMIKKLYSKKLIQKSFFAHGISVDKNNKLSIDTKAWTYYNLGMYKTVANLSANGLKTKGLLAKIVSHAACGDFDTAKILIHSFQEQKDSISYTTLLADALSPYMPHEALALISITKPEPLYSAILLKLEQRETAFERLYALIQDKSYRKKPEVLLYYSNAKETISNTEKVRYLNMYLNLFNIPKIKLIDKTKELSVINISLDYHEKIVDGPLVSIIMTSFNTGERIGTAIESILKQSYQNIELIIVDDASSDDTQDIISAWKHKDERIQTIVLEKNVGTYVAKNIGLKISQGEFITCHDSDDWSHPLKIERQVLPLIKNKHLVASISSWIRLDDFGRYYARPVHPLARQNPSSLMFRKKIVLEKAGVWDSVRTGADSEFIARLRIIFGRKNITKIKEVLAFGAHRENSLMTAQDTGYCHMGMSPKRLEYWELWNKWHIHMLSNKKQPKLNSDQIQDFFGK